MSVNQALEKLTLKIGSDVVKYMIVPMLTPSQEQLEFEFDRIMIMAKGNMQSRQYSLINIYSDVRNDRKKDYKDTWPSHCVNDLEDLRMFLENFYNEVLRCKYVTNNIRDSFNKPIIATLQQLLENQLTNIIPYSLYRDYLLEKVEIQRYVFTRGYHELWQSYIRDGDVIRMHNAAKKKNEEDEDYKCGLNRGETMKDVIKSSNIRHRRGKLRGI